jgi:hypothetical protein
MCTMRIRVIVWSLLGACALAAPAHATVTLATEPVATKLSAYGGVMAWSHWNAARAVYQLQAYIHGRVRVLPVRPRHVPFDVDLGPDSHGRVVAVYSRCAAGEPPAVWTLGWTGARATLPRGCIIYEYDFGKRQERRIHAVVGSGSTYLPTIWRDELAYVRVSSRGAPRLFEQPLTRPSVVVQHGSTRVRRTGRITAIALPGGNSSATGPGPESLDLAGGQLAAGWGGGDGAGAWSSSILLDRLPAVGFPRPAQVVLGAEASSAGAPGLVSFPSLLGSTVYFGQFDSGVIAPSRDLYQRIATTGGPSHSSPAPHALRSVAVDRRITYAESGPYAGTFATCEPTPCSVVAVGGRP